MNWQNYIISTEDILAGKPRVKGTRLSVEFLIGRLEDGWTEKEILEIYPSLTQEALQVIRNDA